MARQESLGMPEPSSEEGMLGCPVLTISETEAFASSVTHRDVGSVSGSETVIS